MKPAGVADEAWKVLVCARTYQNIDDTISRLVYYLTNAGSNTELGLEVLREMSGAQIVDGLLARQREDLRSIQSGVAKWPTHPQQGEL